MNNHKRWIFFVLFPMLSLSMHNDQESLYSWIKDEIGKKWVYQRIIPLGLVAWAGYEYVNNGCTDDRCRNAMSPLIIAGLLVGKQHLYKLAQAYKKGTSPQNRPRKYKIN